MSGFRANPGLERALRRDPKVRRAVLERAMQARAHAIHNARTAQAPWMPRKGHDTIELQVERGRLRLVNTDHGGHLMEWGSSQNPPHAVLRRAVRSAGFRLVSKD